jgi:hypothetical protein
MIPACRDTHPPAEQSGHASPSSDSPRRHRHGLGTEPQAPCPGTFCSPHSLTSSAGPDTHTRAKRPPTPAATKSRVDDTSRECAQNTPTQGSAKGSPLTTPHLRCCVFSVCLNLSPLAAYASRTEYHAYQEQHPAPRSRRQCAATHCFRGHLAITRTADPYPRNRQLYPLPSRDDWDLLQSPRRINDNLHIEPRNRYYIIPSNYSAGVLAVYPGAIAPNIAGLDCWSDNNLLLHLSPYHWFKTHPAYDSIWIRVAPAPAPGAPVARPTFDSEQALPLLQVVHRNILRDNALEIRARQKKALRAQRLSQRTPEYFQRELPLPLEDTYPWD